MPATARLIVMMDPDDKRKLVASAKAQKVSVAKLARERLIGSADPDERLFLETVVELGQKAQRIFAEADARQAREAVARAEQPAREAAIRAKVEAAFAATRAQKKLRRGTGGEPSAGVDA